MDGVRTQDFFRYCTLIVYKGFIKKRKPGAGGVGLFKLVLPTQMSVSGFVSPEVAWQKGETAETEKGPVHKSKDPFS